MNKAEITNAMLRELNKLRIDVLAEGPDGFVPVGEITGPSCAMFFRTADGKVLTAAEVKSLRFEEMGL